MTENNRFKIVDEQFISYYGGTGHKISNEECGFWLWHNKNESQKVCDKLNSILDENEQLRLQLNLCSDQRNEFHRGVRENANRVGKLEKENEQLKQRNNRQAKQLDRLYNLIEEKDWRTLTDIIDDFKQCEEQLQREWKCYE